MSSRLIFSDADSCWLWNVELVLIPGLQKHNAKLYSGYWTAAALRYLTDCLWGLNLTKQPLKKSLQTLHIVHVTLCFSLKLEQLYNVWRADTSLLILQAMWGTAGVFMCCVPHWGFQSVGGFLQQGSLIVKEDHPVARSFPAQLHYIHPGESALAWVASSPPNPGVLLTGVADLWTLCRASTGMWAATSL